MICLHFDHQSIPNYTLLLYQASPFVAGVAALIWSHFPGCNNAEIRQALIETAEDLGDPGRDNSTGFGLVQAKKAFDYLIYNPCVNDTICPSSEVTRSPTASPTLEPSKSMSPTPLPTLTPVTLAPTNSPSVSISFCAYVSNS